MKIILICPANSMYTLHNCRRRSDSCVSFPYIFIPCSHLFPSISLQCENSAYGLKKIKSVHLLSVMDYTFRPSLEYLLTDFNGYEWKSMADWMIEHVH